MPWITYPFIDFITPRLKKGFDIFEYGAGNSTLFYSRYVNSITTVENDKKWFEKLQKVIPSKVKLIYKELIYGGEYSKTVISCNKKFHIVIIDGRDRVNCTFNSIGTLKENGVIIFDNSEREEYKKAFDFLANSGFKRIDFWGFSPGFFNKGCTSIFYREKNCLGI